MNDCAEADARDTILSEYGRRLIADVGGVGFDRKLTAGSQRMPSEHYLEEPAQLIAVKLRGRAAAEKQRIDLAWCAEPAQLDFKRRRDTALQDRRGRRRA